MNEIIHVIEVQERGTTPRCVPADHSLPEGVNDTVERLPPQFAGRNIGLVKSADAVSHSGLLGVAVVARRASS